MAHSDSTGRIARSVLQLLTSGALTALVGALADLKAAWTAVILAGWNVVVVTTQNALEDRGVIPALMKTPPPGK